MSNPFITFILLLVTMAANAQTDTAASNAAANYLKKMGEDVKAFVPDTTDVPDDKLTQKIKELRNLRGGFNINEAIAFKIEEDRQNKETPEAELNKIGAFFTSGNGKRLLDNSVIWIYRRRFTEAEINSLLKFYKTSAGQKMASNFPLIMMQSLKAAEIIKAQYLVNVGEKEK